MNVPSLPAKSSGVEAASFQPILRVADLSVRRGGTVILDGVSWTVRPGEHWVILGANGSGKTSLLSALTGYLMPTAGSIDLLGRRYGEADWRELRKRVGLVSSSIRQMMADTEPALESVISGKDALIDFWGKISAADRRRGMRILRQIECGYLADRAWQFLSQGERQRVLIGRALMADPPLLILDEPCAGLDPAAREHFLEFIRRLASSARSPTLVLITHHVEEIRPQFTHVLLLRAGKVIASGAKDEVLTSRLLSAAFGTPMRLRQRGSRYQLSISGSGQAIM
ncbi:MAG: ABC transporter ATP-binding protein [Verrucomicrobiota bacterium]